MKPRHFLSLYLKGLAIGTAAIIPGISGGTIAFMLGIYDQLITAIVRLKSAWRSSLSIILPVGFGALTAILMLTYPMTLAFTYAPLPTVSLFAGFIVGSLPHLRRELPKTWSKNAWMIVILPAIFAASLGVLSVIGSLDATTVLVGDSIFAKLSLPFVGALGVSAFIVPGISGSMLLLSIGFYEPILSSLSRLLDALFVWNDMLPEFINFGFLGVGALVGFFTISLLMKFLFDRHRQAVSLGVFGFIIGSLFSIYFNYEIVGAYEVFSLLVAIFSLLMFTLGVAGSYTLYRHHASR